MATALQLNKGSALVVVAHPDDESIWMGGTILTHPSVEWTIVALCRGDDPDRAPKFRRVMAHYGARGIISDVEDDGRMTIRASVPEIERHLMCALPRKNYDYVFTHAPNGEYGHPRHKGVSRAVRNFLRSCAVGARRVFFFAYRLDEEHGIAVPKENADCGVILSGTIWREKRRIIRDMYGFGEESFEYRSSGRVEKFIQF